MYAVYTSYYIGGSDKGAVKPPPSETLLHLLVSLLDILFCIDCIKGVRQQCSIDLNRYTCTILCYAIYYDCFIYIYYTSNCILTYIVLLYTLILCLNYTTIITYIHIYRYKRCIGTYNSTPSNNNTSNITLDQADLDLITSIFEINTNTTSNNTNTYTNNNNNYIYNSLKEKLTKFPILEEVVIILTDLCIFTIEKGSYFLPNELYKYIRILPYILAICDGPVDNTNNTTKNTINNIFINKKIKITQIQKIFIKYPILPIIHEISITLVSSLELAPHYYTVPNKGAWIEIPTPTVFSGSVPSADAASPPSKIAPVIIPATYRINTYWNNVRDDYTRICIEQTSIIHILTHTPFDPTSLNTTNIALAQRVYTHISTTTQCIAKWYVYIQLILTWKYTHPAYTRPNVSTQKSGDTGTGLSFPFLPKSNTGSNTNTPLSYKGTPTANITNASTHNTTTTNNIQYEHVIYNNFTSDELTMYIDILYMIKSMVNELLVYKEMYICIIRYYIHHRIQQLVQGDLIPVLHR